MKVRVKYAKTGPLKFISHLDVMRYFQKNIRRAGLDVAYSAGLSPHQIISFAAPMPLMLTSEAEYFDAEFASLPSREEFLRRLNETGVPDMRVIDASILPEKAINAMAAVTASEYRITLTEKGKREIGKTWKDALPELVRSLSREKEIFVMKKTKKKEEMTDIRPMIHNLFMEGEECRMLLAAGSKVNLRPEQVLGELCVRAGIPYDRFHFDIHRLETFTGGEDGKEFRSLILAGNTDF
ncbi:MAG: TIGR03936 family radical SAM-associated protein [Eubacterium sp.]|nr:TIGR03936 family radical SAM-associated protein [Eubacterium sp.]